MWLIYALGGGWGHLTRAAALARAARPYAHVCVLSNSPYVGHVREVEIIPPCAIQDLDPDVLIVDTFPRGLGGDLITCLRETQALKVLVHRDLQPRYVEWASLRSFVPQAYDLVLIPCAGEGSAFADLPIARITEPWLIRSSPELPRRISDAPCVLICAAGNPDELDWYAAVVAKVRELAPDIALQCIGPYSPWTPYWPALDLFPAADVVVGGAGYNTIEECLACKVPLVARAWPRKYDRQRLRAQRAAERGRVTLVEQPEGAARAALSYLGDRTLDRHIDYVNGAEQAAEAIDSLLHGGWRTERAGGAARSFHGVDDA